MYEAKIHNLGLCVLTRFCYSFEYLSFLGGEAQRSFLKYQSRVVSVWDSYTQIPLYFRCEFVDLERRKMLQKKALTKFCYLLSPFTLVSDSH